MDSVWARGKGARRPWKFYQQVYCINNLLLWTSMAALNPSNPRAAFNIFQPFVPSRWRCKALARWTTSKVSNWERPVPEGPVYFDPPPEWNENDWGNAMPGVGRNGAPRGHHGSNLGHPWWGMATWSSIVSLLRLSCYGYLLDEHQHIMNV
jgi:hypothetical protein